MCQLVADYLVRVVYDKQQDYDVIALWSIAMLRLEWFDERICQSQAPLTAAPSISAIRGVRLEIVRKGADLGVLPQSQASAS